MPDCAYISGYIHMAIHTEVLIETFKDLSSDLRWLSCNIFSNQYPTMSAITYGESAAVFYWKSDSLKEYWDWILNALIWLEDDGKGHRTELIVDDGVDTTLLIHEGYKEDDLFLKDGTIHEPRSTDNNEFNIVQTTIKRQLESGETDKRNKIANTCMGVSEDTSTGVNHLYTMDNTCIKHQKWERMRTEATCAK